LYNLGRALQQTGDHLRAAETLERAIELYPDDPSFHLTLAGSYEKLGRHADAVEAYRHYLEQNPATPDAQAIEARIARLTGSASR
ncbi:MAG TPA: tetratricopeptide repeat protein, partial [Vicinamibacterales bacterium]